MSQHQCGRRHVGLTPAITCGPRRARALPAAFRGPEGQGYCKARDRLDRQVQRVVRRQHSSEAIHFPLKVACDPTKTRCISQDGMSTCVLPPNVSVGFKSSRRILTCSRAARCSDRNTSPGRQGPLFQPSSLGIMKQKSAWRALNWIGVWPSK